MKVHENDLMVLERKLSSADDFSGVEVDAFLLLSGSEQYRKLSSVTAFLNLSNWKGTSMRDGVWAYYECADAEDIRITHKFLLDAGYDEIALHYESGIRDYQNPIYQRDFDYPSEWLRDAELIDAWIFANEKKIELAEYELLIGIMRDLAVSI